MILHIFKSNSAKEAYTYSKKPVWILCDVVFFTYNNIQYKKIHVFYFYSWETRWRTSRTPRWRAPAWTCTSADRYTSTPPPPATHIKWQGYTTSPQSYLNRQGHDMSCKLNKLSHFAPVRNKIVFKGIIIQTPSWKFLW